MSKNIRFERKVFEEHVITNSGEIVSSKTVYNLKTEPEYVSSLGKFKNITNARKHNHWETLS